MAQRRMFSKTIIETDAFLDMSQTAQNLYFHLGMRADDDGFVSPKMVMRLLGSTDDDIKVLAIKKFVIPFETGVIVIRHWKQNNYIQNDRYTPTIYKQEYLLACEDDVYKLDTQVRLGKDSKDKFISKNKELSFKGQRVNINYGKYQVWSGGKWTDLDPKYIKDIIEK